MVISSPAALAAESEKPLLASHRPSTWTQNLQCMVMKDKYPYNVATCFASGRGLLARKDDTPAAADKPLPTALGLQPQHDALPVGNDIRLPVARKQQGCGIEGCRLKRNIAPQETRG
eukprot:3476259-Rhodomonas_salina.1